MTSFDLGRIGAGLSFTPSVPALLEALASPDASVVVQAPPGSGKTTVVPPAVANLLARESTARESAAQEAPAEVPRSTRPAAPRVLVTSPRRVAARAAASRLRSLMSSTASTGAPRSVAGTASGTLPPEALVGHTVRGESTAGPDTRVEFLTPGVLVRRLLNDPELPGIGAVVLDEVHERSLDTDLLLGMLAEVAELRGDLRLVAMSATVDAPMFARALGSEDAPAPVVDSAAALHPVEVQWAPFSHHRTDERGVRRDFLDHVARTAVRARAGFVAPEADAGGSPDRTTSPSAHTAEPGSTPGDTAVDALVFVPGAREVSHIAAAIARLDPGIDVLELHGGIPAQDQDRAVRGRAEGERPRIVVSTSLAESSLTVPGVRVVVDAGLSREPRRDLVRGMSGLVTVSASQASCVQRAGRAGRLGPGLVVRCFDERTFAAAPAHITPEVRAADLTDAVLTLAAWGSPRGEDLRLPEPLPAEAARAAEAVLHGLGAVDDTGAITARGRALAQVPADPRIARALLDGAPLAGAHRAAEVAAALASGERAPGGDLEALVRELRDGRAPAARAFRREVDRLERIAQRPAGTARGTPSANTLPAADLTGYLVALAHPERIAREVPERPGTFLLSGGTRAALPGVPSSATSRSSTAASGSSSSVSQSSAEPRWLAVAEVQRASGAQAAGTGAVIRAAAALSEDTALLAGAPLRTDPTTAEFSGGKVRARRERRLGAIVLSSTPTRPDAEDGRKAVQDALRRAGTGVLDWSDAARALRSRLALLHRELGDPWPDVSETGLLARLDEWLGPEIDALARGASARSVHVTDALRRLLPWPEAVRLDELVPERLEVPSGSHVRITYPEPEADGTLDAAARPLVEVKLQECFGWAETPRLVDGRVPVLFHLLSPGRAPLAITDDLASFWSGPYAGVRAEMRGRYPKHPWPEDPWTAVATKKTNRALRRDG
ncbi:ATP-dependent RNA helicase [Brevibacterium samyangense]|uniref:ATP-dependent helicase HrpB n=1 Tax=Brevibacterium samyangense TaxID=366888 RepID=A0ABN2TN07_9MICO